MQPALKSEDDTPDLVDEVQPPTKKKGRCLIPKTYRLLSPCTEYLAYRIVAPISLLHCIRIEKKIEDRRYGWNDATDLTFCRVGTVYSMAEVMPSAETMPHGQCE